MVNWLMIFPALILAALVLYIRFVYIKSARDIKRFEGIARSPVYSHVSTTINGLASIRAFKSQEPFERQFLIYQNDHSATWFSFISTSRALGLVVDILSTVYVAITTAVVMATPCKCRADL